MKILIVNFEYPPLGGGGGVATHDIAQELGRRHNVHILTTWYQGLARDEQDGPVHVHRVGVWGRKVVEAASLLSMLTFVPAAIVSGWRLCRKERFDVINAQFVVPSGLPALFLAKVFRRPLVVSFIGGDIYDPSKGISPHRYLPLRWLVRFIASQAYALTAISNDTKERARDLHGVTKAITCTPLGIRRSAITIQSRTALGLPEGKVAVSIGRLIPRKGFDQLLRVWTQVPDAHLVIIGSGPLEEQLRKQIQDLRLEGRVHLVGHVTEERKMSILAAADVYVSAATHEGFGIVFLEAMHAGLPVVASDHGGQRDFLTEGKNALLYPLGDDEALRAALLRILNDPELHTKLTIACQQTIENYYIDVTTKVFESVLIKAYDTQPRTH